MPELASGRLLSFAAFLCLVAQTAGAQSFTDVYVFGDSLSDTGNACTVLVVAGYELGRCSNGDVWSERFAEGLGLEAEASILGGTNFANGGDEAADLDTQIFLFELTLGLFGSADPDALYVVWLGGNDVLGIPSSPTAMQDAVDDILAGIQDLQALGAQHFLVPNLPDIGRAYGDFEFIAPTGSPFTPAERDAVTALSLDFNDRLATALAGHSFVSLYERDVEALVEELFADPAGFGIVPAAIDTTSDDTDFAVPCLVDLPCLLDPQGPIADGYFLFDAIHPTTATHAVIADRAAQLVPEPGVTSGLAASLLASCALARRRETRRRRSR